MFGKNQITKVDVNRPSNRLKINSVFYTIQGEGPFSGQPAIFVRFAGCNLRCHFCDTEFETFEERSVYDLVDEVSNIRDRVTERFVGFKQPLLVVITGGEPFLQPDLGPFTVQLLERNFKVQIETAGTAFNDSFEAPLQLAARYAAVCDSRPDSWLYIVVSPKTPHLHPRLVYILDCLKYVIKAGEVDESDGLPITHTQAGKEGKHSRLFRPTDEMRRMRFGRKLPIYVSPCDEYDETKNAANLKAVADISMRFGYIVSLQVHKILGLE